MTTSRLGIFGTSGFAREVADIAMAVGYNPFYIVRDDEELIENVDGSDVVRESELNKWSEAQFTIGIGDNSVREKIAKRHSNNLRFVNLIHPAASFGNRQMDQIDRQIGVIICAGVRLTNNIRVGNFNILNLNCTIGHDTELDDFVNISPGANVSGNVYVEARAWIGTGVAINQGNPAKKLKIGADTIIGSGSVVVKNCDSFATYVGIPARRLK